MVRLKRLRCALFSLGLGLVGTAGQALAVDQAMVDAAKDEGRLVWYSTLIIDQAVRPMATAFQEKYGIEVAYSRAPGSDVALKVINEARAGRVAGDVFDSTTAMIPLLEAGLVESYAPEAVAAYPDDLKDPEGRWATTHLYFLTTSYNTEMIPADEVPRTYDDLLDPKWRGAMAWTNDLTPSGAPGFIYNMLAVKGEEKGMDYLRKLAEQRPATIAASQRVVLDRVISGEYPLGLMTFNHHDEISRAKGAPVDWIKMEPLVATTSAIGILKNAPHPNAAKLFVEFVLSEEGQKVLAEAFYLPAHPDVPAKVPELKPEGGDFTITSVSPATHAEGLNKWISIYNDLFR